MWFPTSMRKKRNEQKKTKDDAIFNIQNSKDKQKMRVKDDTIIKQVQIITTSTFLNKKKYLITQFGYKFFFLKKIGN